MADIWVDSTAFKSVGYRHGCLEITFDGGHIYRYFGVPEAIHAELLKADSKSHYFENFIRGRYLFARID